MHLSRKKGLNGNLENALTSQSTHIVNIFSPLIIFKDNISPNPSTKESIFNKKKKTSLLRNNHHPELITCFNLYFICNFFAVTVFVFPTSKHQYY